MIVLQLSEYLKNKFPAELIYTNERVKLALQSVIPDRNLLVRDYGGTEVPWYQWTSAPVQIVARDVDVVTAQDLSEMIFADVTSRFGLILPAVTIGTKTYPQKQTGAITAIQTPSNLGNDSEGRIEYVFNILIKYRRT